MIERFAITDRASWLAMRSHDLTASDIGAVIGIDPYKTPYQVWAEKAGLAETADSNILRRGRWLEPAVLEALKEELPDWRFVRPGIYLRDPDCRLGATPDALGEDRLLIGGRVDPDEPGLVNIQLKVISRPAFEKDWAAGSAPIGYQLQTLCEGMLLDAAYSLLAALVLDTWSAELELRTVPRHAAAEQRIRDIARRFWTAFEEGHAPQPDYSRDAETVRALFPPDPQKPAPIDFSTDNRLGGLLSVRAELKDNIKAAEEDCAAIDAEIVHKLDGAEAACLPGWKISHTIAHRDAYQVAAKDYPVLRIARTKEMA
jgi:predicted phage-related endonuclease